jgi:hypothetical protein
MGKLVQVATNTVTSAVASVTLTGIDSDDVYMVAISGYLNSTASGQRLRVTVGGTPDTSLNYDFAGKFLRADTTFTNGNATNQDVGQYSGLATSTSPNAGNHILYLYNWNNASEYSFWTFETVGWYDSTTDFVSGHQGGGVHTVAQSCDGVQFFSATGNITAGTFTLYKVL